jgi:uncharacterized membrane protein
MSHLVAIRFNSHKEAKDMRRVLGREDGRRPVDMADMAIVYRDGKSRIKMDRTTGHQGAGTFLGGLFGALLGLILPLPVPLDSALTSALTGAFGAGIGALGAKLIDEQNDRDIVKEIGNGVERGKAVLMMLVDDESIDAVLSDLSGHQGNLVKASVSPEVEEKIQTALKRRNNAA